MGHDHGSSEGVLKNVIFATFSLSGKLYTIFLKEESFFLPFTFNMTSPPENTDAGDSDFDMSTSEEEIDSESRVFS